MFRWVFFSIAIIPLLQRPVFASQVIIKPGDTLSEISTKYKVSIKSLIRANGITNPNDLKIGRILIIPSPKEDLVGQGTTKYIVKKNESINMIAKKYNIDPKSIISLNNLVDANLLFPGQELLLVKNNLNENYGSSVKDSFSSHTPQFHVVKEGENLTWIGKTYGLKVNELVELNKLENPNSLYPGLSLALTKPRQKASLLKAKNRSKNFKAVNQSPSKKEIENLIFTSKPKDPIWKKYGPLQVDWSRWSDANEGYIAPSLHKNGNSFYIAINCDVRRINISSPNGSWRNWMAPIDKFEYDLLDDLCNSEKISNKKT